MYLDIFKERMENFLKKAEDSKEKVQLIKFQKNIIEGVNYYKELFTEKKKEVITELEKLVSKYPVIEEEL